MTPQKDGSLKATVSLEYGKTYQYRYLLNNGIWINDENAAEFVPQYQIQNCVITIPAKKIAVKKATLEKKAVKKTVNETKAKADKTTTVKKGITKKATTEKAK